MDEIDTTIGILEEHNHSLEADFIASLEGDYRAAVRVAAMLQAENHKLKAAIATLHKCFREREPTPSEDVAAAFALKGLGDE